MSKVHSVSAYGSIDGERIFVRREKECSLKTIVDGPRRTRSERKDKNMHADRFHSICPFEFSVIKRKHSCSVGASWGTTKMYLVICLLVILAFLIRKFNRDNARRTYFTFDQFQRFYCSSPMDSVFSTVDMFHRCDTDHPIHRKSNDDYQFLVEYLQNFLCHTNENIHRPGPVCPFVPRSLKQQSIYFYVHHDDRTTSELDLMNVVRRCRADFLHRLQPIEKHRDKFVFKCLLIVVQSANIPHATIERVQTLLKPEFVLHYGLMIGQFYQSLNAPAKHNEHFYPLRTKCPLLVIRYLVADDIEFLNQKDKYPLAMRLKFIRKYLHLYHSGLLYRSKSNHLQVANQILAEQTASSEEQL